MLNKGLFLFFKFKNFLFWNDFEGAETLEFLYILHQASPDINTVHNHRTMIKTRKLMLHNVMPLTRLGPYWSSPTFLFQILQLGPMFPCILPFVVVPQFLSCDLDTSDDIGRLLGRNTSQVGFLWCFLMIRLRWCTLGRNTTAAMLGNCFFSFFFVVVRYPWHKIYHLNHFKVYNSVPSSHNIHNVVLP